MSIKWTTKKLKKNNVEKVDPQKVKKNNVDKEGPPSPRPPARPSGRARGRQPPGKRKRGCGGGVRIHIYPKCLHFVKWS